MLGHIPVNTSNNCPSLVWFWLGVRECGSHRSETFAIPSSLSRIVSTPSWRMLRALANWFIVIHKLYITALWIQSLLLSMVSVAGHQVYLFPPKFSCLICTVDKVGESSPIVTSMSVWMSLGKNFFFLPLVLDNTNKPSLKNNRYQLHLRSSLNSLM